MDTSESADRRERRRSRTRQQILGAALDLFERKGYEDTTIEEIAEAADISSRTFFRYFDSKLELVLEDETDEDGGDVQHMAALLAERPAGEGPLDAIQNLLRAKIVEDVGVDAFRIRQIRVAMSTPSIRPMLLEHFFDHWQGVVAVFAERAGASGDDLRARVTAAAAVSALWAAFEQWVTEGGDAEQLAAKIDETFEIVKSGLN